MEQMQYVAQGDAVDEVQGGTVVPFVRPAEPLEPAFSSAERRELRKMLRQFARVKAGCPTARRESGE